MQLDPSQQAAVELGCTVRFGIITGGPGTGKSTSLKAILDELDIAGEHYALAAPTGKAARRMTEAAGGLHVPERQAKTIHRLLEWQRGMFTRNRDNPLDADVVIVDEASMLDVELAADLVRAVRPNARLILVGDANQLPSVGPGRLLADLVESGDVPVARLTHVHRSAAESWICRNAPKVLAGERLELATLPDFRFFEASDGQSAAELVRQIVRMPEYAGAQVLSPQRTFACGTNELNLSLQAQLNPPAVSKPEWKIGDRTLRTGDRVIQTVNNYTLNVFNGEVGTIVEIVKPNPLDPSATDEIMLIDFGDRVLQFSKSNAINLELAYALTVHKCQGSEFPWVICVVHSSHTHMLSRQLFYTAITRAKKGVVLVGNVDGINVATSAKEPPKRNTMLIERMRKRRNELANQGVDDFDLQACDSGFAPPPRADDVDESDFA
jgi:exodeoxyribonuclease V alpha subunit